MNSSVESEDHPRVCGEKAMLLIKRSSRLGSPPRVRGKAVGHSGWCASSGITPACAGKRPFSTNPFNSSKDHPRVCGEKQIGQLSLSQYSGSPPRVRGKGNAEEVRIADRRITPACAGKRQRLTPRPTRPRDHPRVCGEKWVRPALRQALLGSPPRVRGKA